MRELQCWGVERLSEEKFTAMRGGMSEKRREMGLDIGKSVDLYDTFVFGGRGSTEQRSQGRGWSEIASCCVLAFERKSH